jgi:hypothetical protein
MRASLIAVLLVGLFAGCTAEGASSGNFELKPDRIGWYAGERASFTLNITASITRQAPDYLIDRNFAIEEIRYDEKGASLGGDYETRNPDDVSLRLLQDGVAGQEFVLDVERPTLTLELDVPEKLRDSEYVLEVKLFKVGWVKSDSFRIDIRNAG